MNHFDEVQSRARGRGIRIVMIGQGDGSLESAAALLAADGTAVVTIVGDGGIIPDSDPRLGRVAAALRDRWPERVRDGIHALDLATNPLLFAIGLTAGGDADVCLGGTAIPLDALEEAGRWLRGPERGTAGRGHLCYLLTTDRRLLTLVIPDSAGPLDAKMVARLALQASDHRTRVIGDQSRVGFLVAPPSQDASHAEAELALAEFRLLGPGIPATVEWNWTLDSGATEAGQFRCGPNVLIFPDPISGHLAELVLRDATDLRTWGPLFPGSTWTLAGVPEGASPADIVAVATLAAAGTASA